MSRPLTIDTSLRERRRIIRLLEYLKRDDLTGDQMERIGRRLQKSGKRALKPLVRRLWREQNGTAIYRYTCMLDFFDDSGWLDQLIKITLQRKDLEEDGRLALLDLLHDSGIDVTAPPFAGMTGYGATSLEGFTSECLQDGDRGMVRFIDSFLDVADEYREMMTGSLAQAGTPEAVALLEILTTFEKPEIVREAVRALGRIKHGTALMVLEQLEPRHTGDMASLIRRSIQRLAFLGIREPLGLPATSTRPLPFHEVYAGPIDFYGVRSLWFSWELQDHTFAGMLVMTGEADGVINAISYRMRDSREYGHILQDVLSGEQLMASGSEYVLALLNDALYRSREQEMFLPPDLYVDMRLFSPEDLRPEAYVPRFALTHLDGIVEKIPGYAGSANELLDEPGMEEWLLSEPAVYDAAERFNLLEGEEKDGLSPGTLENEISRFCSELIIPRRAEIVKRLLLMADFRQQTGESDEPVQKTLAVALSLVGGFLPEHRHPFIRRLVLDSIDTARQALAEGYDLRQNEGFDDDEK